MWLTDSCVDECYTRHKQPVPYNANQFVKCRIDIHPELRTCFDVLQIQLSCQLQAVFWRHLTITEKSISKHKTEWFNTKTTIQNMNINTDYLTQQCEKFSV